MAPQPPVLLKPLINLCLQLLYLLTHLGVLDLEILVVGPPLSLLLRTLHHPTNNLPLLLHASRNFVVAQGFPNLFPGVEQNQVVGGRVPAERL